MPLEIAFAFSFVSLFWFGLFSYLEYASGMTSKIHAELPWLSMLMALITTANCLVISVMGYLDKSSSEDELEKYLVKMGAFPLTSHTPVPVYVNDP